MSFSVHKSSVSVHMNYMNKFVKEQVGHVTATKT